MIRAVKFCLIRLIWIYICSCLIHSILALLWQIDGNGYFCHALCHCKIRILTLVYVKFPDGTISLIGHILAQKINKYCILETKAALFDFKCFFFVRQYCQWRLDIPHRSLRFDSIRLSSAGIRTFSDRMFTFWLHVSFQAFFLSFLASWIKLRVTKYR